jgi:hypothetical protein
MFNAIRFTPAQKIVDSGGRVDKFRRRGKASSPLLKHALGKKASCTPRF